MSVLVEEWVRRADLDEPVPYALAEEPPAWKMTRTPVYECDGCGRSFRSVTHKAAGYCSHCYNRLRRPRPSGYRQRRGVPLDVVAEEFNAARVTGMTRRELADALGMKRATLDRSIQRARRAGLLAAQ